MNIRNRFKKNRNKIFKEGYDKIKGEFDENFYKNSNPDVVADRVDPITHYLEHGSKEGRRPTPDFDPHYYIREYGNQIGKTEPFVHYVTVGRTLGFRSSELDVSFSSENYNLFKEDYDKIKGEFDEQYYKNVNPDVVASRVDPIIHYLENGSREGRRPIPDFDPHYYLREYADNIGKLEPFVHYVTEGRALGFRGAELEFHHTEQLVYPNGVVPSRRPLNHEDFALAIPLPADLRGFDFPKVAAIIHAYYPELMDEIFEKLEACPCPIDIFVSTDTEVKKRKILEAGKSFRRGQVEVRVTPNRGRDVGPMLTAFRDVFEEYPAFLHLHTKKSPHGGDGLASWRDYLFASLIGSRDVIETNLTLLDRHRKGFVFPQHFYVLRGILNWGFNFENASRLLREVGVTLSKDMVLEFPSGTMFWARTAALKGLLSLDLRLEDFDEEAAQVDGTLAHAIERTLLFFGESEGFGWAKVLDRNFAYPHPRCILPAKTADDLQQILAKVDRPLIAGAVSGHLPLARTIVEAREILFAPSLSERPRFVLLVPSVNPRQTFGGISTAIKLFKDLAKKAGDDVDFAIVTTDAEIEPEGKAAFPDYVVQKIGDIESNARFTLIDATRRTFRRLPVRAHDIFFATAWWTALFAKSGHSFIERYFKVSQRYIYLVQDYEPNFYGWASNYALAESTYFETDRFVAIINSEELYKFFEKSQYKFDLSLCLPYKLNENINKLLRPVRRERVIMFYGRPSVRRNAFEIICDALAKWQMQNPIEASNWRILSVGEDYDERWASPVQNISVLGKLTLEQYAYWLNRSSIGISLMLSPHPSYPPLEMAEAGLMVITNDYGDRHMTDRFDLTSLPYLSPDLLVEALEACVERYRSGDYPVNMPRAKPKSFPFDEAKIYSTEKLLAALKQ